MMNTSPQSIRLTGINCLYPVTPDAPSQCIRDAVLILEGSKIKWVGTQTDAPQALEGERVIDLDGAMVTPGWIDSHTHIVWAGSREHEFRMRLEGKSYLDIAQSGGGIMSTVREVRKTALDDLVQAAHRRARRMIAFGVTTIEAKSGYGLSLDAEIKLLEATQRLGMESDLDVIPTFLGAHTIPTEWKHDRQRYIDIVCEEMIPEVVSRGLAESCDVFVEKGAFSIEEARRILQKGQEYGLTSRLHADQLSGGGGAALAAELGAASADHLEEIAPEDISKLAQAGVVACLIPGSTFCLQQDTYAPARALIDGGVTVALATDLNPGTTCSENLAMLGTMACVHMHMTPLEVLEAVTLGAARSLQRADSIGTLAPGMQADITVFDAPNMDYLLYHYGISHVRQVFKKGASIWERSAA